MSSVNKIGSIEAICLIVIMMINHIILNIPKFLIESTGTSIIINIIWILIIALLIVFIISKILKHFPNMDILDISEFLGGKVFKNIIGILFIIYFIFTSSIFLRSFCESIKIIYFQRTPIFIIVILFIIGIVLCNRLGTHSIIRSNLIFMPIILLTILFIFLTNMKNFTPERIFPILGNGINATFFSGISNIFAFGGISLLYFVPPYLKDSKELKKVAITSIIISGIWLLFSVATLLFIFPFIVTTDEILPLYLASRFIEFGRFFQRIDAVFLLIWIISIISYLNIVFSFATNIFKKLTNFKYHYLTIYGFAILLFILSIIPRNISQIHFLETTVYKYCTLILVFVISLLIITFAYFKYKKKLKQKGDVTIE